MIIAYQPEYLDAVMQIWLETNRSAHSFVPPSYWESKYEEVKGMIPSAEVLLYLDDGALAGFIGIAQASYIAGLFVREIHQHQGIGARLLACCKERYEELTLHVYAENKQAVQFYQKHGFTVSEEQTDQETGKREYRMCWQSSTSNPVPGKECNESEPF